MRSFVAAVRLGLLGAILAVPATAGESNPFAPPPVPQVFFCRSNTPLRNTFYFSAVMREGVAQQQLENSFRAFLMKTYSYPNDSVSCPYQGPRTEAEVQTLKQQVLDNIRALPEYAVVETNWKYAAAPLQDSAPPPQPPSQR
jgi:hypothetical protein